MEKIEVDAAEWNRLKAMEEEMKLLKTNLDNLRLCVKEQENTHIQDVLRMKHMEVMITHVAKRADLLEAQNTLLKIKRDVKLQPEVHIEDFLLMEKANAILALQNAHYAEQQDLLQQIVALQDAATKAKVVQEAAFKEKAALVNSKEELLYDNIVLEKENEALKNSFC